MAAACQSFSDIGLPSEQGYSIAAGDRTVALIGKLLLPVAGRPDPHRCSERP